MTSRRTDAPKDRSDKSLRDDSVLPEEEDAAENREEAMDSIER